jgi:hypothetical protein
MKECHKCYEVKPLDEFNRSRARADGHAATCRKCMKVYRKIHYDNNSKKIVSDVITRRNGIRAEVWEYKATNPCVDCGESNPIVLDFDHLGDKEFSISLGVARGLGMKRIMEEIAKCDVLCANCHRKRTFKRGGWVK